MPNDLGPQKLRDTYQGLLQIPGWDGVTAKPLLFGDGTATPISISPTDILFNGAPLINNSAIWGETPNGVINGSNAIYTTVNNFVPGSIELFVNGLRQRLITDFNTFGTTILILNDSPTSGDSLRVNYIKG